MVTILLFYVTIVQTHKKYLTKRGNCIKIK